MYPLLSIHPRHQPIRNRLPRTKIHRRRTRTRHIPGITCNDHPPTDSGTVILNATATADDGTTTAPPPCTDPTDTNRVSPAPNGAATPPTLPTANQTPATDPPAQTPDPRHRHSLTHPATATNNPCHQNHHNHRHQPPHHNLNPPPTTPPRPTPTPPTNPNKRTLPMTTSQRSQQTPAHQPPPPHVMSLFRRHPQRWQTRRRRLIARRTDRSGPQLPPEAALVR